SGTGITRSNPGGNTLSFFACHPERSGVEGSHILKIAQDSLIGCDNLHAMARPRRLYLGILVLIASAIAANAAETIPAKPDRYFNDYAGVVSRGFAERLNTQLAQFERDTSDQVVVAVYRKMQSESSIEDYAQRIAQTWQVGQKDKRNGIVLLVFLDDRKASIQVGYGLEGALPD